MSPVASLIVLIINLLALILSFSALMLAAWQNPGTPFGRALSLFLAGLVLFNLAECGLQVTLLFSEIVPFVHTLMLSLVIFAFGYCTLTAFTLLATAAGLMKEAWQVINRAGVVALILLFWPLMNGELFSATSGGAELIIYQPAGIVAAVTSSIYCVLTLAIGWRYRRRIEPRALLISISVFLLSEMLTLIVPLFRTIALPTLVTAVVSATIGYSLVKLRLFNPLSMHTAQLAAVRDLMQAVTQRQELPQMLNTVAIQARTLLNTGVAVITLIEDDQLLHVVAQDGNIAPHLGKTLYVGEGLAGRAFQTRQPMNVANYRAWDGRSAAFSNLPLYASLSVPIVDRDDALGVLTVHESEAGRIFGERERAVLEMLVVQASVGIVQVRLSQDLARWKAQAAAAQSVRSMPRRTALLDPDTVRYSAVTPAGAAGSLLATLLQKTSVPGYALMLDLAPNLPPLPIPAVAAQKILTGAVEQLLDDGAVGGTLRFTARGDGAALLIVIERLGASGLPITATRAAGQPDLSDTRIHIRLEQTTDAAQSD